MLSLKKYLWGSATVAISIGLVFSVAFAKDEFQGEYVRQEPLADNWLELFWAYDSAEGWIDNVLVTRGDEVLLADNFDSNELNDTIWVAQIPDDMFSVEDGALYVNKVAVNITGILAAEPLKPPFVFEFDLRYGSGNPRGSLVSEMSSQGKFNVVDDLWATEISAGQDAGGDVGVFSTAWKILGKLPEDEYNHYKISLLDAENAQVVITEGPGEPVKIAVESAASKLTSAWGKIKYMRTDT